MSPDQALESDSLAHASDKKIRTLIENSQINDAEALIKQRLNNNQQDAGAWHLWSEAALKIDQTDAALQMSMNAAQAEPENARHLNLMARCFYQAQQATQALSSLQQSLQINPDQSEANYLLSRIYFDLEQYPQAEQHAHVALAMDSQNNDYEYQMGLVLKQLNQSQRAIQHFKQVVQRDAQHVNALLNLAAVYLEQEDLDSAADYLKLLLALNHEHVEARFLNGVLIFKQGNSEEAIIQLNELGQYLKAKNMHVSALSCFEKSLEIDDRRPDTLLFYGDTFIHIGEIEKGIELMRLALEIKPDFYDAIMNLLFSVNYLPNITAEELFQQYVESGRLLSEQVTDVYHDWSQSKDPGRRLKVGYVSADFCNHVVSKFVLPVLLNHSEQFEVYAFSNGTKFDSTTDRIKAAVNHWVDISDLKDDEVAASIHDHQIDIVVDLSGHTLGNRLKALIRRPAPVQVSWLGYGYTTGLESMDYFLSDDYFVPQGYENLFTEAIYRLDRIPFCYEPGVGVIEPNTLPALSNDMITLGCVSRSTRLNDKVIETWSRILNSNPNTRLLLDNFCYTESLIRENILARFQQQGVDLARVLVRHSGAYWQIYHEVDIVLDTFPHNSGTTTFDALWMGVPVVSKIDRPSVGRFGASILNAMEMTDWLTEDEDEYCHIVEQKIADKPALADLRSTLRLRMDQSPLCDGPDFARAMENGFRNMWQTYCEAKD